MDNGMNDILDTYLYESNSLLDQLDEMLVKDEKEGDFSPGQPWSSMIAVHGVSLPVLPVQ